MRIISFQVGREIRLGGELGNRIVDLNLAYEAYLHEAGEKYSSCRALAEMPSDTIAFLELGPKALSDARELMGRIESKQDFVRNAKRQFLWDKERVKIHAPIRRPRKIIVVGLNYGGHVKEAQVHVPESPWTFAKVSAGVLGPKDPIRMPRLSRKLDGEAELAVIIGKKGKYIPQDKAMEHVAGYSIFNDLSVRDLQFEGEIGLRHFFLGKNFEGGTVLGPALITKEDVTEPHNLTISMYYNDRLVRHGNTNEMIHRVETLIAFYSKFFTLEPGDVISTGCPSAVEKRPQHVFFDEEYQFLRPGDRCICRIEGLGELENRITE